MLVCRNKNQCPIKEVLTLDESCPDILQIFRVKGVANADDLKIMEDKVIVEGIIDTNVLYVAESDDTPLYSFNAIIPYRQVIETRGSNKNMDVELDITIDHIGFNMLSGREVEVRFLITFNTKITEERETSMITDVEIFDMDKSLIDNVASMTVYIVSEGDNLWQIAKKYNTRIDDLVNVNELSDENNLETGQKLLILKKV
jgi:nucleoid-associated protein YgaU